MATSALAGLGRVEPAQRLDDVKRDVDVRIVEVRNQRGNGPTIAPFAQNQRRLDAKVRVVIVEEHGPAAR